MGRKPRKCNGINLDGNPCESFAMIGHEYCVAHAPTKNVSLCIAMRDDGNPCKAPAVTGREYCHVHGGSLASGIITTTIKTGRYSKNLPTRLAATYLELLEDEEWLDLRADNALLSTRIEELLGRIDIGDSVARWQKMSKAYKDMIDYSYTGQITKAKDAMDTLGTLINSGLSDSYTWKEVFSVLEQRRRLVETQRRLDQDKGRNISVDRAMIWVGAIMDSLTRNVSAHLPPDQARDILKDVGRDLERLLYMEPNPSDLEKRKQEYDGVVDRRGLPASLPPRKT